ncbi:basic proline-rich protein-like [Dipodomys spectabilis]|uniref:basic proline-rich protein-like n=1 Tax=Dipodomys spectabilis TaxID=105255 RepID=UPI001C5354DF|nr:basic proline-rich protein-like [Dipodomys spectabilis]
MGTKGLASGPLSRPTGERADAVGVAYRARWSRAGPSPPGSLGPHPAARRPDPPHPFQPPPPPPRARDASRAAPSARAPPLRSVEVSGSAAEGGRFKPGGPARASAAPPWLPRRPRAGLSDRTWWARVSQGPSWSGLGNPPGPTPGPEGVLT